MTILVFYSHVFFSFNVHHFLNEYNGVPNNITTNGNIAGQISLLFLTFGTLGPLQS
jgi:hypothetical protein